VIPWRQLDSAKIPGGGGELRLKQRGAEFSIMLGSNELMNSRLSGSEQALARLACQKIRGRRQAQVLIGGLGMGFTLRAALAELADDAAITVAELVPAVVAWAHGPMAEIFGGSLGDAILLDVDNGPEGLSRQANDGLYDMAGLAAARGALSNGGVLAVWSSGPDARFTRRLRQAGFDVEEVKIRANGTRGARQIIWIASKEQ
jgi:spermidine synthase